MLFSLKILRSDWTHLFFHTRMNRIYTSTHPLHSDWLCVTLLTPNCDVTVMLFMDKPNVREVILFNRNSTILNQINCTQIFVIQNKKVVGLLIISIDINIYMKEKKRFANFSVKRYAHSWPQQVKFTLSGHLFTHLGFPEFPCCLECDIYSRLCYVYVLMMLD